MTGALPMTKYGDTFLNLKKERMKHDDTSDTR